MTQLQHAGLNDLYLTSCTPFCVVSEAGRELAAFPAEFASLYAPEFYLTLIAALRQSPWPESVLEYHTDEYRFVAIAALSSESYLVTAPVSAAAVSAGVDQRRYLKYVRGDALDRFTEFIQDIPPKLHFSLSRLAILGKQLYSGDNTHGEVGIKYYDSERIVPLRHQDSVSSRDLSTMAPGAVRCSASHMENLRDCIKRGDFQAFSRVYHRPVSGSLGTMSSTALQQTRYSYITLLHIIASAAAEGGMPYEYSFDLFNHYCLAMDRLNNISEIERLKLIAADDFCKKVAACQRRTSYHRTTLESIKYIHRHIYRRIRIQDIAGHVHLNRSTLSAYFKQDTGMTIIAYINAAKLKEAKYLLEDPSLDYPQIIDLLGFCSQSYFIKRFHERFGITPQQYRDSLS